MKEDIVEKLASDQEFINWVINPTQENELYWKNWLKEYPEQEEALKEARSLILSLQFSEFKLKADGFDRVLTNVLKGKRSATALRLDEEGSSGLFKMGTWFKMAAVLILIFSIGYLLLHVEVAEDVAVEI